VKWLSDAVVAHLRAVADWPDLSGTHYEIVEKIGQGGMAAVYRARDRQLDREVAIKVLAVPEEGDPAASRLLSEAKIVAQLEHPGIVPVHDLGVLPDGRVYYVMKLVRGKRLDESTERDLPALLRTFEKICQAVEFAHAHGVIHRDLKPQNVMVGEFGEVLVLDWGVAKRKGDLESSLHSTPAQGSAEGAQTKDGCVIGTPGYMAPEQARGDTGSIDERTDVYALGAILYFLLTGQAPARSASESTLVGPREWNPSAPKAVEAICLKALSPERDSRYARVAEISADVGRYLAQLPVAAYRETILDTSRRLFVKYRTAILLVLAYLVVRVVLLFWAGT
jgi:serine/threonine protein kinase